MARPHSPAMASPSPPPPAHPPATAPTTAAAPPTKRDVRRNRITERLNQMIDSFSTHQHAHYRAQLQAVQVDMTLVLKADPYAHGPLEDGGEEVRAAIEEVAGGVAGFGGEDGGSGSGSGGGAPAHRDFVAMAGKRYTDYVRGVNDCLEARDADLTALHDHYHASLASLEQLTQQKLHQAEEEHRALSSTVRQRLIASITKKRQQLLRDKEQLDIADSNALLLHPAHFTINNPGSPGGPGQNRKTRHLRHRATSPGAAAAGEGGETANGGKKKRKAAAMDPTNPDDPAAGDGRAGNESPAPPHAFTRLPAPSEALGGGRSPFKDARKENGYAQFEAPAYSLERIFTEKELAMATSAAQQATWRYFHTPQEPQQSGNNVTDGQAGSGSNGTAVPSVDGGEGILGATAGEGAAPEGEEGAHPTTEAATNTPPPSQTQAPDMERAPSHQVLTRGTARANPLTALSELATASAAAAVHASGNPSTSNPLTNPYYTTHAATIATTNGASSGAWIPGTSIRENPFAPQIPQHHAVTRNEKSAGAPTPGGVGPWEGEGDMEMMRRAADDRPDQPPLPTTATTGTPHGPNGLADPADIPPDIDMPDSSLGGGSGGNGGGGLYHPSGPGTISSETLRRHLLDHALATPSLTPPYRLPLLETGPAVNGKGVERPSWTGFSDVRVYEQQRARLAMGNLGGAGGGAGGGAREVGAGTGRRGGGGGVGGGEAMSRTTSVGAGSEVGGGGGGIGGESVGGRRGGRGRLV